jgi:hypothetical protein
MVSYCVRLSAKPEADGIKHQLHLGFLDGAGGTTAAAAVTTSLQTQTDKGEHDELLPIVIVTDSEQRVIHPGSYPKSDRAYGSQYLDQRGELMMTAFAITLMHTTPPFYYSCSDCTLPLNVLNSCRNCLAWSLVGGMPCHL